MADKTMWTSKWVDYRVVSQARGAVVLVGLPVLALPEDTAVNLVGECSVKPETNLMILLVIGIARGMAGFGCDLVGIDLSEVKMPKVSKCYSEKNLGQWSVEIGGSISVRAPQSTRWSSAHWKSYFHIISSSDNRKAYSYYHQFIICTTSTCAKMFGSVQKYLEM